MTEPEFDDLVDAAVAALDAVRDGKQRSATFRTGDYTLTMRYAPLRHGCYGTYANQRCRCRPCRDAWNAYMRAKRGSMA